MILFLFFLKDKTMFMENRILIVTWPSWVWKDTVVDLLVTECANQLSKVISFTTRKPRHWEIDWINYEFLSIKQFEELKEQWQIFQFSKIWDNYYWYTNKQIIWPINSWIIPICIVDPVWMRNLKWLLDWNVSITTLFLLPPQLSDLFFWLQMRDWVVNIWRYEQWVNWIRKHRREYDHLIFNYNPEDTKKKIQSLLNIDIN